MLKEDLVDLQKKVSLLLSKGKYEETIKNCQKLLYVRWIRLNKPQ